MQRLKRQVAACGLRLAVGLWLLAACCWLCVADRCPLTRGCALLIASACVLLSWSCLLQPALACSGLVGSRSSLHSGLRASLARECLRPKYTEVASTLKKISAARHRSAARVRAPRELYVQSTLKKISAARHQSAARARTPRDGPSDKLAERMSMFKKHGKYTYFVISLAARQLWVSAQVPRGLALRPSFEYVKFLYLKEIS